MLSHYFNIYLTDGTANSTPTIVCTLDQFSICMYTYNYKASVLPQGVQITLSS